ncbi:DUF7344 domain-containing protein [Halorientalis marina]|uniref:DUF7344 domain-containing protein n=1 Tax=Halorientalis marina TaxID=2931976 RepID=UPI001FF21E33|nr:hypothetical protein [Halorientalis marina]
MSISKGGSGPGQLESAANQESLSEDQVFEVLSNERRRYAFHYLKHADREVYLRELAERVAAWENDKPLDDLSSSELKRVKTALHQHHLPKMDDNGFIRYDSGRESARISESASNLEVYLDVVPKVDVPWSLYYTGLAAVGFTTLLGRWADAPILGDISYPAITVFVLTAALLSGLVHTYYNYSRLRLGTSEEPPEVRRQ